MEKSTIKKWWIASIGILLLIVGSACEAVETNTEVSVEEDDLRVATVGDSITYYSFSGNNYPEQLDEMLGEDYAVQNFGESNYAAQSSSDFPYGTTESYKESLEYEPELVIFMLGTNDTKAKNWDGAEQFKAEYTELLESYLDLESVSRVILATPPTVFLENPPKGSIDPANIEPIHDVIEEVATEYDLEFVDMTAKTAGHPDWFFDGIHPTETGAEQLATIFYDQIKNKVVSQ